MICSAPFQFSLAAATSAQPALNALDVAINGGMNASEELTARWIVSSIDVAACRT